MYGCMYECRKDGDHHVSILPFTSIIIIILPTYLGLSVGKRFIAGGQGGLGGVEKGEGGGRHPPTQRPG